MHVAWCWQFTEGTYIISFLFLITFLGSFTTSNRCNTAKKSAFLSQNISCRLGCLLR